VADVKVAALYDVHGNAPALEAVLRDGAEEADVVVFGGDLVWGAWPRETLALARALGDRARFIMGNTDRSALTDEDDASALWVQERLDDEERSFVLSWPATLTLDGALYCHATPRSDTEIVTPLSPGSVWDDVLAGVDEEIVVCGHLHYQYDERHAGHRVVNAGSIGNPTIRPTAWWAMLDAGDVDLRTTDYDTRATAEAWRATGFQRTDFADELLEPYSFEQLMERLP
jgi:predicted phosphodiesterase